MNVSKLAVDAITWNQLDFVVNSKVFLCAALCIHFYCFCFYPGFFCLICCVAVLLCPSAVVLNANSKVHLILSN